MMNVLDLHGVRHHNVKITVENFLFSNEMPVKIITGNSVKMKQHLFDTLEEHGYKYTNISDYNLGEFLIYK